MDLGAFLVFIGTPAAVDYVISNVLDQWPKWVNWTNAQAKGLITLALSIALGLLSYALVQNVSPAEIAHWQPLFSVIAALFSAWASGQIQHEVIGPWASARRARLVARKEQFAHEIKTAKLARELKIAA